MKNLFYLSLLAIPLWAQNNILDLRPLEIDDHGTITYQNFIYSRYLVGGKALLSAVHIRIPPDNYREFALGVGYNFASLNSVRGYLVASLSSATDDYYFQPALMGIGGMDRWFAFFYLTCYLPLGDDGINQWLLDPFELQYTLVGPLSIGFSSYYYRPNGGEPSYKLGGKMSYAHRYGSLDVTLRRTNRAQRLELQLRTVVAF